MSDYNLVTSQAVPQLPAFYRPLLDHVETLRKASVEAEEELDGLLSRWHGLSDAYETGHTDQVLSQADPLKKYVLDLVLAFESAADALAGFADTLAEADVRRTSLQEDIKQFHRDLNATPVPFSERSDLRERNVSLWQQTYSLQRTLDSAVEDTQERLARIQDPPTLPHANSEHASAPGNAEWLESMRHVLLSYLSAPIFAMLQRLADVPLSFGLEAALSHISTLTGPVDADTHGLEKAWLLWGITNGGELFNDPYGPCGDRMVCVVGDLPTGPEGNAMVLGRVVVFDANRPDLKWQLHEYAHVVDQVDVGSRRFLEDYAHEAAFTTITGGPPHDGNILEQSAELRANAALAREQSGDSPYTVFQVGHYDSGYEPVEGGPLDWSTRSLLAKGYTANTQRLMQMRRNMGIGEEFAWQPPPRQE